MNRRRWIELGLLFGVAPWLISLGPRWWILPAILGGGVVCLLLLLADPTFDRRRLLDVRAARRGLGGLLLRTAVVWTGVFVVALVQRGPGGLFLVPRARPELWLLVMVLYPLFSAYPQEIMFRTFFFHRYAELFRRPVTMIVANAVLFGWAHIIVHSFTAMLLTTLGGSIFAYIYHRSRSTVLVGVEHAFYGDFVFTVGIGGMFVNGVRLLSKVVG